MLSFTVKLCQVKDTELLSIGTWYSILEFLNVVGVVTNSFLVAFTSQYGRNWEGGSTFVTVTQELFNSTTNATIIHQTVTEHTSARNRLWIIIGFEVCQIS